MKKRPPVLMNSTGGRSCIFKLGKGVGTLPDLGSNTRFARTGGGNEFFPPVARKRVCAGKPFAGFPRTILISPPQRPIFACGKNGKAPKKKD